MSVSHLTLVPDDSALYFVGKGPESRAERIQRMQLNARALAFSCMRWMRSARLSGPLLTK